MSDAAGTKPDPTTNAPEGSTENKPAETTKPAAEGGEEKPVSEGKEAPKTTDSVFSMFGGGPKKEKKEEPEEGKDEPSGSSKAQKKGEEVSFFSFSILLPCCPLVFGIWYIGYWGCVDMGRLLCATPESPQLISVLDLSYIHILNDFRVHISNYANMP